MSYGCFKKVQSYGSSSGSPDDIVRGDCGYARGPERQLLSALLFDAVQNYLNFTLSDRSSPKSRYREAADWINSDRTDYVFSFESVCDALGVDPNFLRSGLTHIGGGEQDVRRARKNF